MTLDWWFTTELIYIMWQFKGDKIEKKESFQSLYSEIEKNTTQCIDEVT